MYDYVVVRTILKSAYSARYGGLIFRIQVNTEGESFKTKHWRDVNICKSIPDVNAKSDNVDAENGIVQKLKR